MDSSQENFYLFLTNQKPLIQMFQKHIKKAEKRLSLLPTSPRWNKYICPPILPHDPAYLPNYFTLPPLSDIHPASIAYHAHLFTMTQQNCPPILPSHLSDILHCIHLKYLPTFSA
jgi:hypothetical protein